MSDPVQTEHIYLIGNSPKLPIEIPVTNPLVSEQIAEHKVHAELLQEEDIFVLISTQKLHRFTINAIEHALAKNHKLFPKE